MKKLLFSFLLIFLFQYFFYVKDLWELYILNKIVFVLIGLLALYIFVLFFLKRNKLYPYTVYILSWFLVLIIFSSISASLHFGQPILYGLVAEIKIYAITFYFLVLFTLKKSKFSYKTVESLFVKVGILSLIVFYIIACFFKEFLEGTEFLKYDLVRGWRLNLPFSIVTIVFFYYLQRFLIKKRVKYLLFPVAAIFFLIFFEKSRMLTIGILVVTLSNFLRSNTIKLSSKIIVFICVLVFSVFAFFQINFRDLISNSSLAIRLLSVEKVISFMGNENVFLNLLIGSGGLNPVFFKPLQEFFDQSFWPSDVGLLGIFFEFGALGIIFSISLWIILIKEIKKAKLLFKNNHLLINAFENYIHLSILLSPLNPMIIYQLGVFSTILGILVYLNYFYRKNRNEVF